MYEYHKHFGMNVVLNGLKADYYHTQARVSTTNLDGDFTGMRSFSGAEVYLCKHCLRETHFFKCNRIVLFEKLGMYESSRTSCDACPANACIKIYVPDNLSATKLFRTINSV